MTIRVHVPTSSRRDILKCGAGALLGTLSDGWLSNQQLRNQTNAQSTTSETLRVLSYNIHMWQIDADDLATLIQEARADIVGLNEAWDESRNDAIAEKLGFNAVYGGQAPKEMPPRKAHTVNGHYMPQVLLTKHKIIESRVFNAMAAKEHEDFDPDVPIYRGGTLAILETERGTRLAVFVLHLHPWGAADDERMTTMRLEEMKGILRAIEPYGKLPTLLIGDFNTRSDLDGFNGGRVTRHLAERGFTDVYRSVHPETEQKPGLTCGESRIDYIFVNDSVESKDARVIEENVFGSRGYQQSDHLAVLGTVHIHAERNCR